MLRPIVRPIAAITLMAIGLSCDHPASPPATPEAASVGTIVSLSPAATDLFLAMGVGDRLVGVSTYDFDPRVERLPRVGDYLNADWERIAALRPGHIVAQMAADRVPSGFVDRARSLGAAVHRVQIDRLDDITTMATQLGNGVGRPDAGEGLSRALRQPIDAVRARVADCPPVRTLIVVSDDGMSVVGGETYLDDLLTAAGGVNVLGPERTGYIKIDAELMRALAPDAILQLAPATTPAAREASGRIWSRLSDLPAVRNRRVLVIDEPWALMPGAHVGELAERFAAHLHPVDEVAQ